MARACRGADVSLSGNTLLHLVDDGVCKHGLGPPILEALDFFNTYSYKFEADEGTTGPWHKLFPIEH